MEQALVVKSGLNRLRRFFKRLLTDGKTKKRNPGNFIYINQEERLAKTAAQIAEIGFVGGGLDKFEEAGRAQLIALLQIGLYPESRLLDVGCGCLRGGYWLVHFLSKNCYFGIEPNKAVLDAGKEYLLGEDVLTTKQPRFDGNEDFDFSVFGVEFDFIFARSVWTHAAKSQIEKSLDGFVEHTTPKALFLTSILLAGKKSGKSDYAGKGWVGKSHLSNTRGTIGHDYKWIEDQCRSRNLHVKKVSLVDHGKQTWLLVSKQKVNSGQAHAGKNRRK